MQAIQIRILEKIVDKSERCDTIVVGVGGTGDQSATVCTSRVVRPALY